MGDVEYTLNSLSMPTGQDHQIDASFHAQSLEASFLHPQCVRGVSQTCYCPHTRQATSSGSPEHVRNLKVHDTTYTDSVQTYVGTECPSEPANDLPAISSPSPS